MLSSTFEIFSGFPSLWKYVLTDSIWIFFEKFAELHKCLNFFSTLIIDCMILSSIIVVPTSLKRFQCTIEKGNWVSWNSVGPVLCIFCSVSISLGKFDVQHICEELHKACLTSCICRYFNTYWFLDVLALSTLEDWQYAYMKCTNSTASNGCNKFNVKEWRSISLLPIL